MLLSHKLTLLFILLFGLFGLAAFAGEAEKIELGKLLFFDPRLSVNNTVSCQSCHDVIGKNNQLPTGTDNLAQSIGVYGRRGGRNAPTVWNAGLRQSLFWDGRAKSLEQQASGPILNHVEMGMPSMTELENKLKNIKGYKTAFKKAFESSEISSEKIVEAIAYYERSLLAKNSPFDRFINGDTQAISEEAKIGWKKFTSYSCIACHGAATFLGQDYFVRFPVNANIEYETKYDIKTDKGRFEFTKNYTDMNRWRVPSLRNVALTGPYLHNGSVDKLEEVVRIMGKVQLNRTLTDEDISQIVAFLKSLTGDISPQKAPQLPR